MDPLKELGYQPRRNPLSMAQYAITFDLDTKQMDNDGLTKSQKTSIYQTEIPKALNAAGFTAHPQGSVYHTVADQDQIKSLLILQSNLKHHAPGFCKYVRSVHVFRMEEWSDITELVTDKKPQPTTPEMEMDQHEALQAA